MTFFGVSLGENRQALLTQTTELLTHDIVQINHEHALMTTLMSLEVCQQV
jgi:hypothetical protein